MILNLIVLGLGVKLLSAQSSMPAQTTGMVETGN
jgi:hypothetical protein